MKLPGARNLIFFNYSRPLFKRAALRFLLDTGAGELAKWILVKLAPTSYVEDQRRLVRIDEAKAKAARLANDMQLRESIVRLYVLNKISVDAAAKFGFRSLTY